jgi:hypothetical protein
MHGIFGHIAVPCGGFAQQLSAHPAARSIHKLVPSNWSERNRLVVRPEAQALVQSLQSLQFLWKQFSW